MAISNVSATFSVGVSYQAQGAAPGAQYQPTTAQGNPKKNIAFKTGKKLHWNAETEGFDGDGEASKLLARVARKPWDLI